MNTVIYILEDELPKHEEKLRKIEADMKAQ